MIFFIVINTSIILAQTVHCYSEFIFILWTTHYHFWNPTDRTSQTKQRHCTSHRARDHNTQIDKKPERTKYTDKNAKRMCQLRIKIKLQKSITILLTNLSLLYFLCTRFLRICDNLPGLQSTTDVRVWYLICKKWIEQRKSNFAVVPSSSAFSQYV